MEKKVNQKETLKKILHRIRKYWLYVVLSITAASVSVALTLYLPILTGNAIDHILEPGNVDFEVITQILKKIGVGFLMPARAQMVLEKRHK